MNCADILMGLQAQHWTLNRFLQGVHKHEVKRIPRVYQKDFPDAASFRGNILQKETPICEEVILYAKYVLCFMCPFRSL